MTGSSTKDTDLTLLKPPQSITLQWSQAELEPAVMSEFVGPGIGSKVLANNIYSHDVREYLTNSYYVINKLLHDNTAHPPVHCYVTGTYCMSPICALSLGEITLYI